MPTSGIQNSNLHNCIYILPKQVQAQVKKKHAPLKFANDGEGSACYFCEIL
jgi:hypothetical protein